MPRSSRLSGLVYPGGGQSTSITALLVAIRSQRWQRGWARSIDVSTVREGERCLMCSTEGGRVSAWLHLGQDIVGCGSGVASLSCLGGRKRNHI
jgi:hypothetical protein